MNDPTTFLREYLKVRAALASLVKERDRIKDIMAALEKDQADAFARALEQGTLKPGVAYELDDSVAVVLLQGDRKKLAFFDKAPN